MLRYAGLGRLDRPKRVGHPAVRLGRAADKRELVAERSEIFAKKLRAAFRTLR
jgi:hypothetical protein